MSPAGEFSAGTPMAIRVLVRVGWLLAAVYPVVFFAMVFFAERSAPLQGKGRMPPAGPFLVLFGLACRARLLGIPTANRAIICHGRYFTTRKGPNARASMPAQ